MTTHSTGPRHDICQLAQEVLLLPQAEDVGSGPRDAHLDTPILVLHTRGDLVTLALQHSLLIRRLWQPVEAPVEVR